MVRIFLRILKNTKNDLTDKESANEIKQYFDIDIHPASVRRILIKFDYRSKMNPKMLLTAAMKKNRLQWA